MCGKFKNMSANVTYDNAENGSSFENFEINENDFIVFSFTKLRDLSF